MTWLKFPHSNKQNMTYGKAVKFLTSAQLLRGINAGDLKVAVVQLSDATCR